MASTTPQPDPGQTDTTQPAPAAGKVLVEMSPAEAARFEKRQRRTAAIKGAPQTVRTWAGNHRPHLPKRSASNGERSGTGRVGIIAALIVAALVVGLGGGWAMSSLQNSSQNDRLAQLERQLEEAEDSSTETTVDDSALDELREQIAKIEEENERIREENDELRDQRDALNASQNAPPASDELTNEIVDEVMTDLGFDAGEYTYDIDRELAQAATSGAGRFGEYAYSGQEYTAFLASGTPQATTSLEFAKQDLAEHGIAVSDANLLNPSNWSTVQALVPTVWEGNTFYRDGEVIASRVTRTDPVGSVAHFYVGPEMRDHIVANNGDVNSEEFFSTRGACANPQDKPFRPENPDNPPPDKPEEPEEPEEPEDKKIYRCDSLTKTDNVLVTPEQAKDTNRYKPVGDKACKDTPPPPEEPEKVKVCDTGTEGFPTVERTQEEIDANPGRYYEVGSPECELPEEEPEKCEDLPTSDDGYCGTPDEGAEQQPVQDNDPEHVAPTDGYEPGDAEQNDQEQGPPCSGDSCGLDPAESGTEVEDSTDGGGAPGGDVVTPVEQPDQPAQPDDSGQPNPDYDGSAPTENPDEGTSDPVDTPVTDETTDPGTDPLEGVDQPNVP